MIYLETGDESFDRYCASVVACITDQGTEHLVNDAAAVNVKTIAIEDVRAISGVSQAASGASASGGLQLCLVDETGDNGLVRVDPSAEPVPQRHRAIDPVLVEPSLPSPAQAVPERHEASLAVARAGSDAVVEGDASSPELSRQQLGLRIAHMF